MGLGLSDCQMTTVDMPSLIPYLGFLGFCRIVHGTYKKKCFSFNEQNPLKAKTHQKIYSYADCIFD